MKIRLLTVRRELQNKEKDNTKMKPELLRLG